MKRYRLTYTCEASHRTMSVDVEADDSGRAEMQGRLALAEMHNPKRGAVSYRGFAGQLAFNGDYKLTKIEAL